MDLIEECERRFLFHPCAYILFLEKKGFIGT